MSKRKRSKKKNATRYNVTAEAFVKAWASSDTLAEVMSKTSLPKNAVYSRVNSYRKKGVILKPLKRPTITMDISSLNAIVEKETAAKKKGTK